MESFSSLIAPISGNAVRLWESFSLSSFSIPAFPDFEKFLPVIDPHNLEYSVYLILITYWSVLIFFFFKKLYHYSFRLSSSLLIVLAASSGALAISYFFQPASIPEIKEARILGEESSENFQLPISNSQTNSNSNSLTSNLPSETDPLWNKSPFSKVAFTPIISNDNSTRYKSGDLMIKSNGLIRIRTGAVDSREIKDGSIRGSDINDNTDLEVGTVYSQGTMEAGGDLIIGGNTIVTNGQINVGDKVITQGDIGVGIDPPQAKLHVHQVTPNPDEILFLISTGDDANRFSVDEDGDFTADGTLTLGGNLALAGTINTGIGATEIYLMNQNLRTTDSPTFAGMTLTNPLSTANGGTGQDWSVIARGNVPYFSAAGTLSALAPGAAGYFLRTNGAGADPSWEEVVQVWSDSGTELYPTNITRSVGIGTTSPSQKLEINYGSLGFNRESAPTTAPTVAVNPAAGNLNGWYTYQVTFVTASGETEAGVISSYANPSNQQIDLSNIPIGSSNVTARKIYRTLNTGDGSVLKLVATINDNATATYTDNIADGSLGAVSPMFNTTGGSLYVGSNQIMEANSLVTILGFNAGRINAGAYNSFLGPSVGYSNTSGYANVAIGYQSLYSNTTGFGNVAIGSNSLKANIDGAFNTVVGMSSLYANTSGNYNTAIGSTVLIANTSGGYNVVLGSSAVLNNQTGSRNVAMGYQAGYGSGLNSFSNNYNGLANLDNHIRWM